MSGRERSAVMVRASGAKVRRTTVYLPIELATSVKLQCAQQDMNISDFIAHALQKADDLYALERALESIATERDALKQKVDELMSVAASETGKLMRERDEAIAKQNEALRYAKRARQASGTVFRRQLDWLIGCAKAAERTTRQQIVIESSSNKK